MPKQIQHLSLTLGARRPYMNNLDSTMGRLAVLLHTPQGHMPWRKDFGCDLNQSLGRPASDELQNEIQNSVTRAVKKWIPDTKINRCEVVLKTASLNVLSHREPTTPLAESALVSMGTDVHAEVAIEAEVEGEPLEISTLLDIE